jgi:2-isopropylmalate synthase
MNHPDVELYDTTLRDGSQGEGVNFSAADKIRIAEQLDLFGIDIIEGGWPGSNEKDRDFFELAKRRNFKHAKISAFSMTRRKGMRVEDDSNMRTLLAAETPAICIVGKTWLMHVIEVLGATPDENLAMISDTVRFFKDKGKIVYYDAEHSFDGYKNEADYSLATWRAAADAGADAVVLCDTNGGCLPAEISSITAAAREKLKCRIGIHTHNDIGLGVANALAGIEAGATQVQGTINGYGERTGNCNLTAVIPNLFFKMKKIQRLKNSMPKLRELSHFVDEVANFRPDPRQPWVGATAFAHKGGMHVHAVDRVVHSYEHIDPAAIGNQRRVLVSDMSGRSNILMKARELGFNFEANTPEVKTILAKIKELESQGYEFEAAEGSLALLISKALKHSEAPFKVEGYHVSMRRDGPDSVCEATIKVRVGEKRAHTVAEGDGPVNALDTALRAALSKFFPALGAVQLTDYKVRILNSDTGTAAKTRVLLESTDGQREWGTVGVSENIIDASLQALVDSIEFYLSKTA